MCNYFYHTKGNPQAKQPSAIGLPLHGQGSIASESSLVAEFSFAKLLCARLHARKRRFIKGKKR